ncbi:MAG: ribonuclease M5 [Anaerovoracaceae bacterium]|jgi:ribonuclease M5|nr:ribonuclease M5 [Anaerovoracaceae bacterium]
MMKQIKEMIVVEGRDDTAALKRAGVFSTIETHGYGLSSECYKLMDKAYHEVGLIIFTDPDHAGDALRKKLSKRYPLAKHAFLDRRDANNHGDIGVENASPKDLIEALEEAKALFLDAEPRFTKMDLFQYGLAGLPSAAERRRQLGKALGIGYANSKGFLEKLNQFKISKEEFYEAVHTIHNNGDSEKI